MNKQLNIIYVLAISLTLSGCRVPLWQGKEVFPEEMPP